MCVCVLSTCEIKLWFYYIVAVIAAGVHHDSAIL